MRIMALVQRLGTTPHAIRYYERRGLLPAPARAASGYRGYSAADAERLRLLLGLRQLDIALEPAAELATMCAACRCDEVSDELRAELIDKRRELATAWMRCATSTAAWPTGPASSRPGPGCAT
ncbi:MAG: MerR family transcriptional regulator [Candidatus Limnocylindria bacterium]